MFHTGNQLGVRVGAGIVSVKPVDVAQQDQQVGLNQYTDNR